MKFTDYKDKVNSELLELMEIEGMNWSKSWTDIIRNYGLPHNAIRGNNYTGMNSFYLSWFCRRPRPMYATYKQWKSIGADMSDTKGKGVPVYFFSPMTKKVTDSFGVESETKYGIYKVYHVFNVDDVKNVDESKLAANKNTVIDNVIEADEISESIVASTKANVNHCVTDTPCYIPSMDAIRMPPRDSFHTMEDYYSTLFHELTHWTGHKSRLNRFSTEFSLEQRAKEELIAEIGSSYLCAASGVEIQPRADHAKYLNSWKSQIKDNPNLMVNSFSKASKAVDLILAFSKSD